MSDLPPSAPPPPPLPPPPPPPPTLPPASPSVTPGGGDPGGRSWWKRRVWKLPVWAWIVIGLVILIGAAGAAGAPAEEADDSDNGADTSAPAEPTEAPLSTEPEPTEPASETIPAAIPPPLTEPAAIEPAATDPPPTVPPATEPPTTPAPITTLPSIPSFGGGTQLVGSDIQPGIYTTASSCYWERLSGVSGEFDDIIANDNTTERGIVEVASTDVAFNSSGCAAWTAFLPGEVVASFGGGDWAVGSQIPPGVYRGDGGDASCYWERGSDFRHEFDGIIANDFGDERPTVEITASDARFTSNGCGTWSLVA